MLHFNNLFQKDVLKMNPNVLYCFPTTEREKGIFQGCLASCIEKEVTSKWKNLPELKCLLERVFQSYYNQDLFFCTSSAEGLRQFKLEDLNIS